VCSLQLTQWLTVAPPHVPDAVVPALHLGAVQVKDSQPFSIGSKAWGGGLGPVIWGKGGCLYNNPEEETGTL
jgi:hypothetical protein